MGYKKGQGSPPSNHFKISSARAHKDSEEMAHNFASVEWLSQSSLKNKRTSSSPDMPRDGQSSAYTWSPVMRSSTKVAHVSPYPGTQRLTSSPSMWYSDASSNYEVSPCPLESPRLSPVLPYTELPQGDLDQSQSPVYSGLYNGSENTFPSNVQKSTCNQDKESQAEQKIFSEDLTHSGCSSSAESGYESEASRSGSTTPVGDRVEESSDTSDEEGKMGRRMRTAFTTEQISTLESTFQKHKYLGASERRKLAAKLQLSEVQIKTWFQNRRMKHKREMQEGRQGHFHATHMYGVYGYPPQPIPEYQYVHPTQHHYTSNPMLDHMSVSYASQAPAMEPLNTYSHPQMPMMYVPYQYEEQQYGRY